MLVSDRETILSRVGICKGVVAWEAFLSTAGSVFTGFKSGRGELVAHGWHLDKTGIVAGWYAGVISVNWLLSAQCEALHMSKHFKHAGIQCHAVSVDRWLVSQILRSYSSGIMQILGLVAIYNLTVVIDRVIVGWIPGSSEITEQRGSEDTRSVRNIIVVDIIWVRVGLILGIT